MQFERSSGILLHITSLPSNYGIGSLGKEAFNFVDFLADSGQKLWQILPLEPTGYGNSPYQTYSAFAGDPILIDLDNLVEKQLLKPQELENNVQFNIEKVEYNEVRKFKEKILQIAFRSFDLESRDYIEFKKQRSFWLDDYALFMSLKDYFGQKAWSNWDEKIKLRSSKAKKNYEKLLNKKIEYIKFCQFIFFEQWFALKNYAKEKAIKIIGDCPIFVAHDSSDIWSNPEIFQLDENHYPTKIAGVPPDYFSKTGQLWGNPLYDWQVMEKNNFKWWRRRFKEKLEQFDILRVDHFRGFESYWAVPVKQKTAVDGEWEKAPGEKMFSKVCGDLGELPIIAEDLGMITEKVIELRDKFEFPGMKILQFAFDSDLSNDYLPHNYPENCVVYTGTHDNETTLGWFKNSPSKRKNFLQEYLQHEISDVCWDMISLAYDSKADMVIIPMQDILGLDNSARMNTPGKTEDNWQWRMRSEQLSEQISHKLKLVKKNIDR